jgi:signal transduction histidine kinase
VLRQLEHVNAMAREVLAFARGESGILARKVYVHKFVEDVQELLSRELSSRNISLQVHLGYRGVARFDEAKIRRAIYNIARNAMEAMGEGGTFTFGIDAEDGWLVMTLSDTGPGIPEEIRDRLFESFVTQGKVGGTGLGLAIVKKIVDDHQGEIAFESSPGSGTTFRIRIPLSERASQAS